MSEKSSQRTYRYGGLVVLAVVVLGVYAWATGQSLFFALDGVLPF